MGRSLLRVGLWTLCFGLFCSDPGSAADQLTTEMLMNGEYGLRVYDETVRVKDGVFERRKQEVFLYVKIINTALGDLNGDGRRDGAVVLGSSGGGSGFFVDLAVVVSENGRARHVASYGLGDRVQINAVSISGGIVSVDLVDHGPADPACCPSVHKVRRFRLAGGQLIPAP